MEVGQVDLVDLDQPQRLLHLALRPLAAVEHQPFAAAGDEHARGRAPRRGHRAAGAEEGDREVHAAEPTRRGQRLGRLELALLRP